MNTKFDTMNTKVDKLGEDLNGKIDMLREDTNAKLDKLGEVLNGKIGKLWDAVWMTRIEMLLIGAGLLAIIARVFKWL